MTTVSSRGHNAGRVIKASTVHLRRTDPLTIPVDQRIAEAEEVAFRAGYQEGFAAGSEQAGAALAQAAGALRASVLAAVNEHADAVRARRAADAEQLVELALAVAEWAVRRELTTVPDAFFARLAEVLADRDRRDSVEITTSPALAGPTRAWLAEATHLGAGVEDIRVVAAEDLDDGEARVLLGDTTVFATFNDAFERARALLDVMVTNAQDGTLTSGITRAQMAEMAGVYEDDDEVVEVLYDATGAVPR